MWPPVHTVAPGGNWDVIIIITIIRLLNSCLNTTKHREMQQVNIHGVSIIIRCYVQRVSETTNVNTHL